MLIKRGKKWYARFQHGGRETWISTYQTSKRAAQVAHDKLEIEFAQKRTARAIANAMIEQAKALAKEETTLDQTKGMLAALDAMAMQEAMTIILELLPVPDVTAQNLWDKYLTTDRQLKPSTLQTKQQRFERFIRYYGEKDCKNISETDCRKFLNSLDCAIMTKNNYISELSSVFKASPEVKNPWGEHLRQRAVINHKKPFTRDHVRQILTHCQANQLIFWEHAVTVGYYTGLRFKDIVLLRKSQIKDGYIDLMPEKTTRNNKRVRIKILPPLQKSLNALPSHDADHLLPVEAEKYQRSRTLHSSKFRKILNTLKIYEPGYGFHSLRHTFITEALNAGIDLKELQSIVGHDAIEVTEGTYYHGKRNADLSAYPEL